VRLLPTISLTLCTVRLLPHDVSITIRFQLTSCVNIRSVRFQVTGFVATTYRDKPGYQLCVSLYPEMPIDKL
jgi:hypothetical protein